MTRATYIRMPSKPVFFSSGLAVTNEHAVEAVIPGFSASQLWCKANLASTVLSLMDLMWPCLVGPVEKTRLLHISQGLNLVWTRSTHMLAILELNWCLGPRTSAERNVTSRRSSATPKRSKKLNGMRDANSLHNRRSAMKPLPPSRLAT